MSRRLRNERNDVCTSPIIFRLIKSRRMRWAGRVTRMAGEVCTGFDGGT